MASKNELPYFKSSKNFMRNINIELDSYEDSKEPVNIVSIGIGGSFEGPKLMLESLKSIDRL